MNCPHHNKATAQASFRQKAQNANCEWSLWPFEYFAPALDEGA